MLSKEAQGQGDLVAEIEAVGRTHEPFVGRVGRRQLHLQRGLLGKRRVVRGGGRPCDERGRGLPEPRRRDVLVARAAEQGGERTQEPRGIPQRSVAVQRQLEEMLTQEDHLLRSREHRGAVGEPGLERVLAEDSVAKGVERADHRVGVAIGHQSIDPLLHLGRGLLREGEGQDLGGPCAFLRDQPRDAAREDRGLAGPGAGDDEKRPVAVGHRFALPRGEIREERRLEPQVRSRGAAAALARSAPRRWGAGPGTGRPLARARWYRTQDSPRGYRPLIRHLACRAGGRKAGHPGHAARGAMPAAPPPDAGWSAARHGPGQRPAAHGAPSR